MILTECPRDAMQGWKSFIPTHQKIDYLNALLAVNFDILDCGSFVSAKAIPQMADTAEVLQNLDRSRSSTRISVIVGNVSGAERALSQPNVDIVGFPFSLSEIFQQRNTNKGREEAFQQVTEMLQMVKQEDKNLRLYFSMAFGNPYGETWNAEDVTAWAQRFSDIGITEIILSDTTGVATPETIAKIFALLPPLFPDITFGAHFHNRYEDSYVKLKAAYEHGCRCFDSAIKGIGGCPMAKDELVGNMPTEKVINFLASEKIRHRLNLLNFETAWNRAKDVFNF